MCHMLGIIGIGKINYSHLVRYIMIHQANTLHKILCTQYQAYTWGNGKVVLIIKNTEIAFKVFEMYSALQNNHAPCRKGNPVTA